MINQFNDLNDMKRFAQLLGGILRHIGLKEESRRVVEFSYNPYSSSSEYLGEFRIVLQDLHKIYMLINQETREEIDFAIEAINKAFTPPSY